MKPYPRPPRLYVDFGKLITDTWRLVWRHKFLWFLGIFAGGGTSMGGSNFNYRSDFGDSRPNGSFNTSRDFGKEVSDWINAHLTLLIALAVAILVVALLLWIWSIICRGAIIGSVRDQRAGKTIAFRSALARGKENFWRLLLLDLFILLLTVCAILIIVAIILFIVLLAVMAGTAGRVTLIMLFLWLVTFFGFGLGYLAVCTIWFLPWFAIGILFNFAARAVVLEEKRPMEAFRRSWRVIMDNLTQTLFMFLISVGLSIGASIAMLLVVGVSAIPAIVAWIVTGASGWAIPGIVIASVLTLLPLAALFTTVGLMNAYFTTYWTIGYSKLAGHEPPDTPRISHHVAPYGRPPAPTGQITPPEAPPGQI